MRTITSLLIACLFVGLLPACRSAKLPATPSAQFRKEGWTGPRTDPFLANLLQQQSPFLDSVLRNNQQWQVQVIYTRIDRNASNQPVFTHSYFNVDPSRYFYPASTVKMPMAILALQKLHELGIPGLDRSTTMITDSAFLGETRVFNEPTSEDGRPSIEHYIRKIFLVSDNDAFNRLYEFLGQEYVNKTLHRMGYDSAQILHRLSVFLTEQQNRATNPVTFYDTAAKKIYQKPLEQSRMVHQPRITKLGTGYMSNGKLVQQPFDFSMKNRLALTDLHSMLMAVIFPESVPKEQRFDLDKTDYDFLRRYMSMMPRESDFPQYAGKDDATARFLMYGGQGSIRDSALRIFNKIGNAYGFLTDVAYFADFQNKVEFVLSATIYCNSDGVFNDDQYDYAKVGYPFMKNLGNVIYRYELQRKKKHLPDLSAFQINYHP